MPDAKTIREHCERRLTGMKAIRSPMEAGWKEIARLAQPMRSRFLLDSNDKSPTAKLNTGMRDGHGVRAARVLTNGMTSGLSSPSRPWFKLATHDEGMMASGGVKQWLGAVEDLLYAFFARTNFYTAVKTGYSELGLFGTEACVMIEHARYGAVNYQLTAGEYWIACSDANVPDTLYRRVAMTVGQCVQAFKGNVSTQVRTAYDQSRYEQMVPVFHAIEPNTDRMPGMADVGNKAYRSVYWDEQEDKKDRLLRSSGYDDQPFWAPRWDTTGSDVYGIGPGFDALPDLRELQMQARRKGEATDMIIFPPLVAPTGLANGKVNLNPKGLTFASQLDAAAVKPLYMVPYQAIEVIRADVMQSQRAVDDAMYASVFNAISQMDTATPPTAEQVRAVNEEKLTQLGPVVERVNVEKLQVAIDRAFGILARTGQLPPAPPELVGGTALRIEFVSILTQIQRMAGAGAIERGFSFVGNLLAAFPEAGDNLDVDKGVDDYCDTVGMPADLVRSPDDVAKLRASRQQQAAAAQAQQLAPAAKDGAQAAQLLSQTDTGGGTSLLQQLTAGARQAA